MRNPMSIIVFSVATLAAIPAMADQTGWNDGREDLGNRVFSELDVNGNGEISRDEMNAAIERRFAQADKDGNSLLTPDELRGTRASNAPGANKANRTQAALKRRDQNGDGALSIEEALNTSAFDRLDQDNNGILTLSEVSEGRGGMWFATGAGG